MVEETAKTPKQITMVLVDTSAFIEANSDFIGLNSALIPSFFDAINEKGITLATHPIIDREIQKHLEDSSIYKNYQTLLSSIVRCRDVLIHAGNNDEELFDKIAKFDIKAETYKIFKQIYSDSEQLDYPEPAKIFEQYFNAAPPFSVVGKKKNEFPDAFVIESIKQYLLNHPQEKLMVVSNDSDWKSALNDISNIFVCSSIKMATDIINKIDSILSGELIDEIIKSAHNEIIKSVQLMTESECFYLPDYDFVDDFEVDCIQVNDIDDLVTNLKITRSSLLIKTMAYLFVDGHGIILNEDNSIWDREDQTYIYVEYADFTIENGVAEVECEVLLEFDFDNPIGTVRVSKTKLNNNFDIEVTDGNITLTQIVPEEDAQGDMLDALEEYYKH